MTDYAAIFDYQAAEKEPPRSHIGKCNLCGGMGWHKVHDQDRYGYPQPGYECARCGLVCLLEPRLSAKAYREFYESGAYRRLVSAYHGREINAETIQPEQKGYALRLALLLAPWIRRQHQTLLDVGGSTGVVAREVSAEFGLRATVLDPAPDELVHAQGMSTIRGQVENVDLAPRTWDVILLCQAIDHLLDPMAALTKLHAALSPQGLFWADALDYDKTRTIKIDHPYNFTERTLRAYLSRVGFTPVIVNRDNDHIGFVCKRAA